MEHGFHLTTTDPEQFQELMSPLVGANRVRPARGGRFDIDVSAKQLNSASLFTVKSPSFQVDIAPPHNYFALTIALGKPFSTIDANRTHWFTNDAHLFRPDQHFHLEAPGGCHTLAACLDNEHVADYAFGLSGSRRAYQPEVSQRIPLSTPLRTALVREIARLWSDLQGSENTPASAIRIAEREDALITNFVMATQCVDDSDEQAGSAVITSAEEYLCAQLTSPVSRAALAAETGVSIRTLSRGFTKRWGTGPMGFLKARRIDAAYRELLGAERDATTVTEVAYRYGFTHLGKFAGEYRQAFHESPSETLRH